MNEEVEKVEVVSSQNDFKLGDVDCFEKNDTIWFKMSDIAKLLELDKSATNKWKGWADDDEIEFTKSKLGGHDVPYASESLLYRILNRSNSPKARPFERWVTKEVIPSIRKTGAYGMEQLSKDFYIPQTYADALILAGNLQKRVQEQHERIKEQKKVIEIQKPKVEFYDTVTKSESTFDMAEVAKLLKIPNIGSVKLFEFLREQNILSDNKSNWNEPYQNYVNAGYFKIVETKSEDKHGNVHVNKKTVVFQKGVDFIRKLAKDNGLIKTANIALF